MRDAVSQIADLLVSHIRKGDRIFVGQGCAQAPLLTRALVTASARIGPCEVFLGPLFDEVFVAARDAPLSFASYAAMGAGIRLAQEGRLRVLPLEYGRLERDVASGEFAADVVLLLAGRSGDELCAAFANDYVLAAARRARCVFVEENAAVPWCEGARIDASVEITASFSSDYQLVALPAATIGAVERQIARNIAALVPNGATLQTGIGAIPDTVLSMLTGHRDLGLHSGVIGEGYVDLVESGALTNARKSLDPGLAVTNTAFGDRRLRDLIDRDRRLRFAPAAYTHDVGILARQRRMVAINSVLEVDLHGRANAEWIEGRRVGGIGGLRAFGRGAMAAPEGLSILALRASDRSGARSRIRPRLDHVTLERGDVDVVVTENGVALLRGLDRGARARALIALAHPGHREVLMRAWEKGEGDHEP